MSINLFPALPEIFLAAMIIVILLVDAFISERKKQVNFILTIVTFIGLFVCQAGIYSPMVQTTFNNMFILDSAATGMKFFTYISGLMITLYVRQYVIDKKFLKGEFYAIYLFSILGMMVMISANSMLTLYLGLELLSLALYALVALDRDNVRATEAAMKFFILGSLGSGILLYGISFVYGATGGKLLLNEVFHAIYMLHGQHTELLTFGLVFVVAGLAFKLGLVPFHMWVPDVYDGAPMAVTTIIGTVTKLAAIMFVLRFLVVGLTMLSPSWSLMLSMLAFLSLGLGNVIAIAQTNIKRMLGYSTIAHMGFVAFALMTVSVDGLSATIFYIVTYVLTSLAGFGVLLLLSREGYELEKISDLKGLCKTQPIYAGVLALVMFSLAGLPPMVGFYAKFKILEALMSMGYMRSTVFAVVMSLIGAFYYLRVVKVMYFDAPEIELVPAKSNMLTRTLLSVNGLLLLILGIMPSSLMNYCLLLVTG